jgi:translation initiation factor IF-3
MPSLSSPSRCTSSSASPRARNMEIKYRIVQVIDPETNKLHPPTTLSHLISSIDLKTHFIELVSEHPNPLVKVFSKKEAYDRRRASEEKRKVTARNQMDQKEIQMTWGVGRGDLAHKLKKVRRELEKGNRVDLVYAPKKGQPKPTPKEKELRVQETLDFIRDVGKEWKSREDRDGMTIIYLQCLNRQPLH